MGSNTVSPNQLMQVATKLQENIEAMGKQQDQILEISAKIMARLENLEHEVQCLKAPLQ
jgi:cell division protein ZapA (FtsZ GTPase activity inhibitor)